jgi:predicted metal-dependent hydrolase
MSKPERPLILVLVADFRIAHRVERESETLGYRARWIESNEQSSLIEHLPPNQPPSELNQIFFDIVLYWNPVLVIIDLDSTTFPSQEWIKYLKSDIATQSIPLLCFTSSQETGVLQDAQRAGVEQVVSLTQIETTLKDLILKYTRQSNVAVMAETCDEPLHSKAVEGLETFNHGDYFDAHELLEEAWMEDQSVGRNLYRGILQVGVAYFHTRRGNYRGAIKMLNRSRRWLDPLPDICRGVDVAKLRRQAYAVHEAVLALGPDHLEEFDREMLKPVCYDLG